MRRKIDHLDGGRRTTQLMRDPLGGSSLVPVASPDMTLTALDRIHGSLKSIAIGDAVGKETETLSREDVVHWYPQGIRGFEGTPGSVIPRYVRNAKHEWRIGETTDDTERIIAVARAIIADRHVSHVSVGREMLRCRKCLHPGIRSLWEFHQAADPKRTAKNHDGCGAAIRVAPVGIFYTSDRLGDLLTGAREASVRLTAGHTRSLPPPQQLLRSRQQLMRLVLVRFWR